MMGLALLQIIFFHQLQLFLLLLLLVSSLAIELVEENYVADLNGEINDTISPPSCFPDGAIPTRSGYLPVDSNTTYNYADHHTGSAMYYAFYEATTIQSFASAVPSSSYTAVMSRTPLLVWLQGGPGCSSMIGNFFELGPWIVSPSSSTDMINNKSTVYLRPNPASWNRLFGVLFFDNPIGSGLSIAGKQSDIPTNQYMVARHLYTALQGFLSLDPAYRERPLYITGESYAGKYVPAIGHYIINKNKRINKRNYIRIKSNYYDVDHHQKYSPLMSQQITINLQGIAIGNGLTDPATQVSTHAATAYFSGLINENQKAEVEKMQLEAVSLIKLKKWREGTDMRNRLLQYLQNVTGLATLYDIRRGTPYELDLVVKLLESKEAKEAMRAKTSDIVFRECSDAVEKALHEDVMKSVRWMIEDLLIMSSIISSSEGQQAVIRVLLYTGQFDLRDGIVSTEAWISKMNRWEGLQGFLQAERKVWRTADQGKVAGYIQRHGVLSYVIVAGAGHLVPADQGLNSQSMIEQWVQQQGHFSM